MSLHLNALVDDVCFSAKYLTGNGPYGLKAKCLPAF